MIYILGGCDNHFYIIDILRVGETLFGQKHKFRCKISCSMTSIHVIICILAGGITADIHRIWEDLGCDKQSCSKAHPFGSGGKSKS